MAVDTDIDRARTRVRAEQEAVDEKLDAYETFIRRVRGLQTDPAPSSGAGITTAGGATHLSTDVSSTDRRRTVRRAFAETIRPHSVADVDETESLLETIREEFTDTIAVVLAPTTDASLTPELKRLVLTEARSRRTEAAALQKALEREEAHLDDAAAAVDDIVAWMVDANERALTDLGFDALAERHETLAGHRACCEDVARDRQAFLQQTTNGGIDAGVRHRRLVSYLYRDFPVDHPVLTAVATLDETCRDCQRAVRDHLVRRA
jgi:capsid protein